MTNRAALVTGASSGIGLAVADALATDGYGVTLVSRTAAKLDGAAAQLRARGLDVQATAADVGDPGEFGAAVAAHRERYGRLDVLVNNAGMGLDAPIGEQTDSRIDLQISVNLRSVITGYRLCLDLLREAAAEHRNATVVNVSSVAGKSGTAGISIYSAAKGGVVAFTQAMNRELATEGIKSCALCPGYVDTALSDYVKGTIDPEDMIRVDDIVAMFQALVRLSPNCVIPEIVFQRPGDAIVNGTP